MIANTVTTRVRRPFPSVQSVVRWLFIYEGCILGPGDAKDPLALRVIVPGPEPGSEDPPKQVPCWRQIDAKDVANGVRPTHEDHVIAGHVEPPNAAGEWIVVLYQ